MHVITYEKGGRQRMETNRFDIFIVDLRDAIGSEQGKIRPCVVVGNRPSCKFSPGVIVMPLTGNINKTDIPTHEIITTNDADGLRKYSLLLGEQPRYVDRIRIKGKLGRVTSKKAQDLINQACHNAFFL